MRTDMFRAPLALLLAAALACTTANAAHAQYVYWLDTQWANPSLHRCDPNGGAHALLALTPGSMPEGLALDPAGRKLYWTESAWTGARVQRCDLDFGNVTTVASGYSCLRGLAIAGGQMFITSSNLTGTGSELRRSNLDGTSASVLAVLGGSANPRGIAYDPAGTRVAWADLDQSAILASPAAGGPVTTLRSLGAGARPYGVAIDPTAGQLWWSDWAAGTLSRAPIGGGAATVVQGGLANPAYLALDAAGNRVFWIEAGSVAAKLRRSPMPGGAITNLTAPVSTFGGLVFVPASLYTGTGDDAPLALALAIRSGNPARGTLALECALPREAVLHVTVLDLQGREVARLADGTYPAGRHALAWPAAGQPPGMYFVRMNAGGVPLVRRVILAR